MLQRLIGKENESEVIVEGLETKALIDTGSMISTISENCLETLNPKPELHSLEEIDLEVKVADGRTLPYLGYVELNIKLPFSESRVDVPFLVVSTTDYNKRVPIIIGTNVLRQFKHSLSDDNDVPNAWQSAFSSVCNKQVGIVKLTSKLTLQPMEVKDVTCLVRKTSNITSAITEPLDNENNSKVGVCPRIVSLEKPGTTARIPVRIFNLSAKVMTLPSKSNVCQLHEVTVLRTPSQIDNLPFVNGTRNQKASTLETQVNQQRVLDQDCSDIPAVNLPGAKLSAEQRSTVRTP
ncbi:MAG: retropepsin-like domain-containing protein [Candidatus Thiodiazotropha taylori]|nr:retropepsin-like domain-containing protein [Candidatus Thiodiazotropha taylori]MCW4336434.1 retropepsin-like domain-containing protein [Candidatus Thiodiazotropha endolucinida]